MKLLILDAGHAEKVGGKRNEKEGFFEWEFNNDMQYKIKKRAEEHGIHVYLTNPNPKGIDEMGLSKRCNLANDYWKSKGKPSSIFISLHGNAYSKESARGTETYYAKNASENSKNFAKILNDEVVKTMKSLDANANDRGVKSENFTVIYKTAMPSVLEEYAFYSNPDDLKILKNNRDELAEATVRAICKYFNIEYKSAQKEVATSSTGNQLFAVCVGAYNKSNAEKILKEVKEKGYTSAYLIPR